MRSSGVRTLLGDRRGAVIALIIGSVLCGLTESGILAILAQSAAALVDRAPRIHVELGPVNMTETLGRLLAFALVLALVRLALQAVVSRCTGSHRRRRAGEASQRCVRRVHPGGLDRAGARP